MTHTTMMDDNDVDGDVDGEAPRRYEANLEERGNGFADVGDYVAGDDGQVYRVVVVGSRIETQGCGAGNLCSCIVEDADWDDVGDDSEPTCSVMLGSEVQS